MIDLYKLKKKKSNKKNKIKNDISVARITSGFISAAITLLPNLPISSYGTQANKQRTFLIESLSLENNAANYK